MSSNLFRSFIEVVELNQHARKNLKRRQAKPGPQALDDLLLAMSISEDFLAFGW